MITLIGLPDDLVSDSLGYAGGIFSDFKILIFLAIGMSVAFAIVNTLRGKNPGDDNV